MQCNEEKSRGEKLCTEDGRASAATQNMNTSRPGYFIFQNSIALKAKISGILDHSHLRRSHHSAIQREAFLLSDENRAVLHPLHFGLKGRFVKIGIESFLLFAGIETLESVLFQGLHQYSFRHLQPVIEVREILIAVILADLICRDRFDGAVEVVYRFQ